MEKEIQQTVTQQLCEQYGGQTLLEIDLVASTFFRLSSEKVLRKISEGEIMLPLTRMEPNNRKSKKFIATIDLGQYIEERNKEARRELASFRR